MLELCKSIHNEHLIGLVLPLNLDFITKLRFGEQPFDNVTSIMNRHVENMRSTYSKSLIDVTTIKLLFSEDCDTEQINRDTVSSHFDKHKFNFETELDSSNGPPISCMVVGSTEDAKTRFQYEFNYRNVLYKLRGLIDNKYDLHLTMDTKDVNVNETHKLSIPLNTKPTIPTRVNGYLNIILYKVHDNTLFFTINYRYVDETKTVSQLQLKFQGYKLIYNIKSGLTCILLEKQYGEILNDIIIETIGQDGSIKTLYCVTNKDRATIRFYDMKTSQKVGNVNLIDISCEELDFRSRGELGEFSLINNSLYYIKCENPSEDLLKQQITIFKININASQFALEDVLYMERTISKENEKDYRGYKARLVKHNNGAIGLFEIKYFHKFRYVTNVKHHFIK